MIQKFIVLIYGPIRIFLKSYFSDKLDFIGFWIHLFHWLIAFWWRCKKNIINNNLNLINAGYITTTVLVILIGYFKNYDKYESFLEKYKWKLGTSRENKKKAKKRIIFPWIHPKIINLVGQIRLYQIVFAHRYIYKSRDEDVLQRLAIWTCTHDKDGEVCVLTFSLSLFIISFLCLTLVHFIGVGDLITQRLV